MTSLTICSPGCLIPKVHATTGMPTAGKRCAAVVVQTTASTQRVTAHWSAQSSSATGETHLEGRLEAVRRRPGRYPGLVELLRKAKPQPQGAQLDLLRVEAWPQDNDAGEADLRQALLAVVTEPVATARQTLLQLEKRHSARRAWVWARLKRAPLACAIEHLATVAEVTQTPLTGATTADMVTGVHRRGMASRRCCAGRSGSRHAVLTTLRRCVRPSPTSTRPGSATLPSCSKRGGARAAAGP